MMIEAVARIEAGAYDSAADLLRKASGLESKDSNQRKSIAKTEIAIRAGIADEGVDLGRVPVLKTALNDLTSMSFSPEEGFILSRINGSSDIGSIVKISPLPELDSLVVFWKLAHAGHIHFQGAN